MRKTKWRLLCICIFSFVLVIFAGCASKPKFKGSGDLCGLIIDENNKPVKDFVVYCHSGDASPEIIKPVITNESGLFVFYNVPSGIYLISGEKTNYLRISKVQYRFDDRTKILCLQTKSFKTAVLSAEELIKLGRVEEAEALLEDICCESKTPEENLIKAYLYFTTNKTIKRKFLISNLKKARGKESNFFREFAARLEEVKK